MDTSFKRFLTLAMALSLCGAVVGCTSPAEAPPSDFEPFETQAVPIAVADPGLPVILAFGDSLTAGEGVDRDRNYPAQLQAELDVRGYHYRVVNQGFSGETTSGGVARLDGALALEPEIVILEFGGNDGLRGVPVEVASRNLRTMIEAFNAAGSRVVLAGMTLPRNYGPDYIQSFEAIYSDLAEELDVVFHRFIPEALVENYEQYVQPDGVHPTGPGYTLIVDDILATIEPYLDRAK